MRIATPLVTILLAVFPAGFVRQAKRAWRDPDREPASAAPSPRSVVALAVLIISFAVLPAGANRGAPENVIETGIHRMKGVQA